MFCRNDVRSKGSRETLPDFGPQTEKRFDDLLRSGASGAVDSLQTTRLLSEMIVTALFAQSAGPQRGSEVVSSKSEWVC